MGFRDLGWASALALVCCPMWAGAMFGPVWIEFDPTIAYGVDTHHQPPAPAAESPNTLTSSRLSARLHQPQVSIPQPAVILAHDCEPGEDFQNRMAEHLTASGYVVLQLRPALGMRSGLACKAGDIGPNRVRSSDLGAAMAYLRTMPFVDPLRIGVVGWGPRLALESVTEDGPMANVGRPPLTSVGFAADCRYAVPTRFIAPVLVVTRPGADAVSACRELAQASRGDRFPVTLHRVMHTAATQDRAPHGGSSIPPGSDSHIIALVWDFLERTLRYRTVQGNLDTLPPMVSAADQSHATWAIDPFAHEPDLPPIGGSLFDLMFSVSGPDGPRYRIPVPFTALVAELEQRLPRDGAGRRDLRRALIPRGRSLQRDAAAPDYFSSPRVVLAAVNEGEVNSEHGPVWTKDRLFIAYQERTGILEVISYNPAAGRFEFQLVRNYGAGLMPEVYYAPRALCRGCHQAGAPIFPNAPWTETNSFRGVFQRLSAIQQTFHGIPTRPIRQDVSDIDRSTNRAIMLPILQNLWIDGCARADSANGARQCRLALITAALQYRLSAATHFDQSDPSYRSDLLPSLKRHWADRWPGGMLLPFANIPDRDPFEDDGNLSTRLDPLSARPAEDLWETPDPLVMRRIVAALAGQFPMNAMHDLSAQLQARASAQPYRRVQSYRARCEYTPLPRRGPILQGRIVCAPAFEHGIALSGRLGIGGLDQPQLKLDELWVGSAAKLVDLEDPTGQSVWRPDLMELEFKPTHRRRDLIARLPDGTSVSGLRLSAPHAIGLSPADLFRTPFSLKAEIDLLDDFQPIRDGLKNLAESDNTHRAPLLDGRVFAPRKILSALQTELDMPATSWCCIDLPELPPARLEETRLAVSGIDPAGGDDGFGDFERFCAACHGQDTAFPPAFLRGDPDRVRQQIDHCAPRIAYRLQMWSLPHELRVKSGMPPRIIDATGTDAASDTAARDDIDRLQGQIAELLAGRGDPDPEHLLERPYADLRACLPAEQSRND